MRWTLVTMAILIATEGAVAQSTLPVQVQADLLQQQIVSEMRAGETAKALDSIVNYRRLGTPLPPALLYVEARLSAGIEVLRAQRALQEYFAQDTKTDPNYAEALRLWASIEPRAKQATVVAQAEADRVRQQAAVVSALESCERYVSGYIMYSSPFARMRLTCTQQRDGLSESASHLRRRYDEVVTKFESRFEEESRKVIAGMLAGTNSVHSLKFVRVPPGTLVKDGKKVPMTGFTVSNYLTTCAADPYIAMTDPNYREDAGCPALTASNAPGFVDWLGKYGDRKLRMISEDEWEYAARAGASSKFPWGGRPSHRQTMKLIESNYAPNKFGVETRWIYFCDHNGLPERM